MLISSDIITLAALCLATLCGGKVTVREYSSREGWHTGTMTPYEVFANLRGDNSEVKFEGYRPIKVWFIGRHGQRYPEGKVLEGMFKVLPKIKAEVLAKGEGNPCYSEELKAWNPKSNLELDGEKIWLNASGSDSTHEPSTESAPQAILEHETRITRNGENWCGSENWYTYPKSKLEIHRDRFSQAISSHEISIETGAKNPSKQKDEHEVKLPHFVKSITKQGKSTMVEMGRRFQMRFKDIIPSEINEEIEFVFTKTARTRDSAVSFATGLFGTSPSAGSPQLRQVEKHHNVLKFDSLCWYWKLMVKRKPEMSIIFEKYEQGDEMSDTLQQVKERCSLKTLDPKTLRRIYAMCSYESGWYDKSPWCKFLTEDQRQILEYVEDLKLYNHCAYGNEMNYRIACTMFNDMFNFFTNQDNITLRFSFSHAKTLIKFTAHLGLFQTTEALREDNYKNKCEREWASAKFAGFAFNLTFVLYESVDDPEKRAVLLMLNEHRIKIPRCTEEIDTYLCPLNVLATIYKNSIHNCHYDEWCQEKTYKPLYEEYLRLKASEQGFDDTEIFSRLFKNNSIPQTDDSEHTETD